VWISDVYTPLKFHVDVRYHKIEIPLTFPNHITCCVFFFGCLSSIYSTQTLKKDYFNITSYEMLSIETPDFVQVNNSLAAMKKAGSGYVKARNIGISVEAFIISDPKLWVLYIKNRKNIEKNNLGTICTIHV